MIIAMISCWIFKNDVVTWITYIRYMYSDYIYWWCLFIVHNHRNVNVLYVIVLVFSKLFKSFILFHKKKKEKTLLIAFVLKFYIIFDFTYWIKTSLSLTWPPLNSKALKKMLNIKFLLPSCLKGFLLLRVYSY